MITRARYACRTLNEASDRVQQEKEERANAAAQQAFSAGDTEPGICDSMSAAVEGAASTEDGKDPHHAGPAGHSHQA